MLCESFGGKESLKETQVLPKKFSSNKSKGMKGRQRGSMTGSMGADVHGKSPRGLGWNVRGGKKGGVLIS